MHSLSAPLACSLLVLACATSAAAAPHPRAVNDGVVRLRSSTFLAGWGYDDAGVRTEDPPFSAETVALLVEAGVAPRLTLAASLPLVWLEESSRPSTGDAVLAGLLAVLEPGADPLSLALALELKLPLYDGAPTTRGRNLDGSPALGDGQVDVTAGAIMVAPLPLGGALDLHLGYRLRTGGITDAVVGGGRFGVWLLAKRIFVSAVLDTVITLLPDEDSNDVIGRGYASIGPRASVRIVDRVFLDVGIAYVGRGTNAPGGTDLMFGASAGF